MLQILSQHFVEQHEVVQRDSERNVIYNTTDESNLTFCNGNLD